MARSLPAGLLLPVLLVSLVAAPLAASVASAPVETVARVAPEGTATPVEGLELMAPPAAPRASTDQGEPAGSGSGSGPSVGDELLAEEKARPTRDVSFYGHVFGLGMNGPQPANTIFPQGDANLGLGSYDWCTDSVALQGLPPQPSPWTGCDKDENNKIALFLTAGPVQVHSPDDFAYSLLHNERGRTKDLVLDTTKDVTANLWMSLDYHSWTVGNLVGNDSTNCIVGMPPDIGCPYPYWGWDPAVWPAWVVEAKLYHGTLGDYGQGASDPPPIVEAWRNGGLELVAEGTVGPQDVTNGLPGSPNVHDFEVNLGKPQVEVIPKGDDIVLVYNFYSLLNGQKVSVHSWRVWAGELFPARFTLPVKNALDIELVIPQFVHDRALVHTVIASAFGSYDVDVKSVDLQVLDGNTPVTPQHITRVGDYQVAHGAHFKPVNITWVWDYKADRLKPGTYKTLVTACNFQHSACEQVQGAFTIDANLDPTDIQVGRQGQRTVTEGQLSQIQQGPAGGSLSVNRAPAEVLPTSPAPRATPGFEALLAAPALLAAVLLRRWKP
jgi:hypothetical protein